MVFLAVFELCTDWYDLYCAIRKFLSGQMLRGAYRPLEGEADITNAGKTWGFGTLCRASC